MYSKDYGYVKDSAELLRLLEEYSPPVSNYFRHGADRIAATINMIPPGKGQVVELGCDSHFTLAMSLVTDYTVLPQNSPSPIAAPEIVDEPTATFTARDGAQIEFTRLLFNVETDRFPLDDQTIEGVLCCEVIEHLFYDPAWVLHEANRILKPGGWLLLTTPNLTSYHAIRRAVQGIHPLEHSLYFHREKYPHLPIQHTREYGFWEIMELFEACGFHVERKETHAFGVPEQLGILDFVVLIPSVIVYNVLHRRHPKHLLLRYRRPHTFVLARKKGPPSKRYPPAIYLQ